MNEYLQATRAIESTHPQILSRAGELTRGCQTDSEKAVRLFDFVRDQIRYNVYMISMFIEDFCASFILDAGKGYCVQKAVLLCALGRAAGIPSRLVFARIRNRRIPDKVRARVKGDIFPAHGYNQFYLEDRWVSAAATFDAGLCRKMGVPPVTFDGQHDACLPDRALDGGPYIEYVERYEPCADLPLDWIVERISKIWGPDKRAWKEPPPDQPGAE